jgi:meiotic recombination protein REC8
MLCLTKPSQPIEVGRNAPPSIPDIDSIRNSMPWNILSSRAGSARPTGLTSSAGPLPGGFEPAFGPPSIRGHRLTSASPLFGRGKQGTARYSSLEIPGPAHHTSGELGTFDDDGFQLPPDDIEDEEFQLHGPAAGVSTQQANNSQWLASTLEDEANNFFAFLQAEIHRRQPLEAQLEIDEDVDVDLDVQGTRKQTVTFDDLLPPDRNSAVVAAQGLLHVLTLVTRGAVNVNQEEDFGEIEMSVVPGVRLVEREVVNNDENHEVEQGIEGINLDDFMGEEEEEASGHLDEGGDADDVDDEDMYG